jgi:hypothetical protein
MVLVQIWQASPHPVGELLSKSLAKFSGMDFVEKFNF